MLTDDPVNREIAANVEKSRRGIRQPAYRVEIFHRNGSVCRLEFSETPVLNRYGQVSGIEGIAHDITRQVRMEEQLEEARKWLQQAQKMESIGNLAGGIAHDFNNILFPIIGMSELLLEDLPPESPAHEKVCDILKAGRRGSDLVRQILAFSRQAESPKMPVPMQEVLKDVLKLCRSTIPANIELTADIQENCGKIFAEPTQLHQIAMNLITNAYHAVEPGGGKIAVGLNEIEVGSDEAGADSPAVGRYALFSVSDTGCGMETAILNKVFEPYFTTKSKGKGTGLGLAVVYGLVKNHGGHIRVFSEAGKGSTFNVFLPLMEKPSEPESAQPPNVPGTGSERILLIDDDPSVLRLEKMMLERLGYRVTSQGSSLDALDIFGSAPDRFDLVITDMTMPGLTGEQLAGKIREIRPRIPVILCTGFSERIDRDKAARLGIKGFLMKPIVKTEMAQMIRDVLDADLIG